MKKILICLLACSLLLASCSAANTTATTIVVGEGQVLVIGQITEINGNELTLALVTESGQDSAGSVTRSADESGGMQRPDGTFDGTMPSGEGGGMQRPDGTFDGTMPSGEGGGMQRPDGTFDGTMPSGEGGGMQRPDGTFDGTMPSGGGRQQPGGNGQAGQNGQSTEDQAGTAAGGQTTVIYSLTGESLTTLIPVGVNVTTQLGTITTFSRLAVGDTIKILMDKPDDNSQVAVAVWIVG